MFESKAYDPIMIVQVATDLVEAYWQANGWNGSERRGSNPVPSDNDEKMEWIPISFEIKLNCDGAFDVRNKVEGVGLVGRNRHGKNLCLVGEMVKSNSPLMTEALTMLHGLK